MKKQTRNFICPESGELCRLPNCTVSDGKVACQGGHRRIEPSHTPQAAIKRATAERKAKREKEAKYAEWQQSEEGKNFAAALDRQFEDAEITYIMTKGVTNPQAIADELNRRKVTGPRAGKWTSRSVIKVLNCLEDNQD
jgi:hypothetical protein